NPAVNAMVTLDRPGALVAAQAADRAQAQGQPLPPLHGVPLTVKDAFETRGLRTTSSHPPLAGHVPARDATAVARLRSAGCVLLGKTNLPELAGDPQCWSPLFGTTRNPWDLARTSGGSSGGSAVAVAMGFSALDLGSDIGGSIRIPAAYCGVAGLKATENRIPRTGHIPHLPGGSRSVRHLLSFGVLARHVEDLSLGLEVLAGADGLDTEVPPVAVRPVEVERGRPLRIAWWDDFAGLPICSRTRRALAMTVERLRAAGMVVERCRPSGFEVEGAWQAYGHIAGAEIGLGMPALERCLLHALGRFLPRGQLLTRSMAQGMAFHGARYSAALNRRDQLIGELEDFLGQWDVWLCPVATTVAYPHQPLGRFRKPPTILVDAHPLAYFEATVGMTVPFSLTGSPVVCMPAGVVDGLPVGLQWVGRRWRDEELLAVCAVAERVLGGYRSPPLLARD
ncbi:MAG TPA: amidase, partial [Pseudomonas sp.]|nr:amidase [Pseudomonas sp.]